MVSYQVEVFTGDMPWAGSSNSLNMKLVGTKGSSERVKLHNFGSLWRGSRRDFEVTCPTSLGTLTLVELDATPFMLFTEDEWFCAKVAVTTPEGGKVLFPCYRWLWNDEKLVCREATAKLLFKDTDINFLEHRKGELERRRREYKWHTYANGLPKIIKADSPYVLPAEVRFSYTKKRDFSLTLASTFSELKLSGLADCNKTWTSFDQINQVFSDRRTAVYEYVQKHWREDEFFGYQFLNGLNPMMIQRCSVPPVNFPVTDIMVKTSLPAGSCLKNEMENGNIFLCDYKLLKGLKGNVVNKRQQYVVAPLCLLYSNPEGKLLPIAIQLKQEPGEENPIFLPTDSEYDWLLAKIFVRSTEFTQHELNFHLLHTHLLAEVFTVATARHLPSAHPLFKLLIPHYRYTFHINIKARDQLISEGGTFSEYTAIGREGMTKFLKRATSSLTYSSLCPPEDIEARGLEDVPNYYYRDDSLKLWKIIHKFVEGVVGYYYTSDADVQKDSELQLWINEIFVMGFLEIDSTGIPQSFNSVKELIKFVTMMIFTVSAQHAAVNNGQFDFGGWMPNFPSTLKLPPPTSKGSSTESTVLETLPDISSTVNIMAALYLLANKSSDHYPLGCYPEELFYEDTPLQMMAKFQEDLQLLEDEIESRNKNLELPYTYLMPKNVDNSVAI